MQLLSPHATESEVVVHPKRVQVRVRDRIYPLEDRSETFSSIIPPEFAKLVDEILRRLPSLAESVKDKEDLYKAFNGAVDELNKLRVQFIDFIGAVFACNTIIRSEWMKSAQKHQFMMKRADNWSVLLDTFKAKRPAIIRVELHCSPIERIRFEVQQALRKEVEQMVLALFNVLDSGVGLEYIGLINWTSEDSCRFHYFLYEAVDEFIGETSTVAGERTEETSDATRRLQRVARDRKFKTTIRHTRCVHEIITAKNIAFPAVNVSKPERVQELLQKTPEFLKPLIRIVNGTEVHRLVIARDVGEEERIDTEYEDVLVSETPRFHPDPAVTLGWFVLTGWGEEECHVRA